MLNSLLLLLRGAATWLAALVILFEQWGWTPLARLAARLGRLPLFAWFEARVQRLPPYAAFVALALPAIALLPVKLAALYWIAAGHPVLGIGLIAVAKLLGTALVARVYQLTQPTLLTLPWFARWHARWTIWKTRVIAAVRASAAWRAIERARRRLRPSWRWLRRRWRRVTSRPTGG